MLRELGGFDDSYPKDRAKVLKPVAMDSPATTTSDIPPEARGGTRPEMASMEPKEDQKEPSFSKATPPPQARPPQQLDIGREEEELARNALADRMARKHPNRPAPRWFDAGEIAMVATCAAAIDGHTEEKKVALRDAITGAFMASREGPPTVRFIWGKLDHFFDHVERGRRRRVDAERNARMQARAEQRERPQSVSRPSEHPLSRAQIEADLEKLFGGPNWRPQVATSFRDAAARGESTLTPRRAHGAVKLPQQDRTT
jgi:hypothetical protein